MILVSLDSKEDQEKQFVNNYFLFYYDNRMWYVIITGFAWNERRGWLTRSYREAGSDGEKSLT